MAKNNIEEAPSGARIILGVALLPVALFLLLSLLSFDYHDISYLHLQSPESSVPHNLVGPVGAWTAFVLFMISGVGAYFAPLWLAVLGLLMIFKRGRIVPSAFWIGMSLIMLTALIDMYGLFNIKKSLNITDNGGLSGWLITHGLLMRYLSPVGAGILLWSFFIISLAMAIGIKNLKIGYCYAWAALGLVGERMAPGGAREDVRNRSIEKEERRIERERRRLEKKMQKKLLKEQIRAKAAAMVASGSEPEPELPPVPSAARTAAAVPVAVPEPAVEIPPPAKKKPVKSKAFAKAKMKSKPQPKADPLPAPVIDPNEAKFPGYVLPDVSLLDPLPVSHLQKHKTDTAATGQVLVDTLNQFGISTEITNVEQGPVVTRYELLPAPGIRVERIAALANNLALSLKATSLRVQAPVPGKGVVGIEIPNETAKAVLMREIVESEEWRSGTVRLPLALGKDVGGRDLVADLAKMPHLLIAGATGSGKSVCINSILTGLLMSKSPDELRLILVDPKIVEFAIYADLPHLVVPVITDPKKVSLSLRWAINEMDRRYKMFAKAKVRNIESFNHRKVVHQPELFEGELPPAEDKGDGLPSSVPYIVIIIDELADLMMAAGAEIENSIARLAQLSRAVGIHMILATQRPSVNVITGTIKANFPARIAFQVAQKVDSRTILDQSGADKLLGRGDMLFLPPGSSRLVRSQGTMVTDDELERVITFIKEQAEPVFEMEIKNKLEKSSTSSMDDGSDDELLEQAIEIIRETHRASTSSLQRRLRIGYTRAARLIDVLEERGVVGPPAGSGPREILIDLDVDIPDTDDSVVVGQEPEPEIGEDEKIVEREV